GRAGEALLFVTPRERHLLAAIEKATRQSLAEMALPSVADVNATRKTKFADSITGQLAAPELPLFRELITAYANEHGVPLADIAAALAVLAQDGAAGSFLLEPDPPADRERDRKRGHDHPRTPPREHGRPRERSVSRVAGQRKPRPDAPMATYRIGVGKRHRVKPNAIVGAIANEGGLRRQDFGHIDIRVDHSLVELPAELPSDTLAALRDTRISGRRIELTREPTARRGRPKRPS
ncbi:MAG TPA: DbpA RNA binding domain-containing protein, partial [Jatrophihabitans sp.]|nr:DbpA RNA binding domain-containing protein [Jatrophihabitans sp.]